MNIQTQPPVPLEDIDYPDSDGQPMAENTLQFMWIVYLQENFEWLFRDRPDVFVAGDLLWYPVKGDRLLCTAPDTLIAFGRPKGYRGSYMQWLEDNVAPQVVWEVLSPGNRAGEMLAKLEFYERYGVEEYYEYDPEDPGALRGWLRDGERLRPIANILGWTSPRTGVRMDLDEEDLVLVSPNGKRFLHFDETRVIADEQREAREAAEARVAAERSLREAAEASAGRERRAKETADARAERLASRLRALGVDPDAEES